MKKQIEIFKNPLNKEEKPVKFTGEVTTLPNGDIEIDTMAGEHYEFRREQLGQSLILTEEQYQEIKGRFEKKRNSKF